MVGEIYFDIRFKLEQPSRNMSDFFLVISSVLSRFNKYCTVMGDSNVLIVGSRLFATLLIYFQLKVTILWSTFPLEGHEIQAHALITFFLNSITK